MFCEVARWDVHPVLVSFSQLSLSSPSSLVAVRVPRVESCANAWFVVRGTVIRTPKTQRAKRALEARAPKVIENPKKALFLRGHHTSAVSNGVLRDLVCSRGSASLQRHPAARSHDPLPL